MSIVQTQTTSFKEELYKGVHDLTTDIIKIALYTADANLNADTTVYTASNEASGGNYVAGGSTLSPVSVSSSGVKPRPETETALISPNRTPPELEIILITAAY